MKNEVNIYFVVLYAASKTQLQIIQQLEMSQLSFMVSYLAVIFSEFNFLFVSATLLILHFLKFSLTIKQLGCFILIFYKNNLPIDNLIVLLLVITDTKNSNNNYFDFSIKFVLF